MGRGQMWSGVGPSGSGPQFEYYIDAFAALRTPSGKFPEPFWIASVVRSSPQLQGKPETLLVYWYDLHTGSSIYTCNFKPLIHNQKKGKSAPWMDEVDADSVLMSFLALK